MTYWMLLVPTSALLLLYLAAAADEGDPLVLLLHPSSSRLGTVRRGGLAGWRAGPQVEDVLSTIKFLRAAAAVCVNSR